MSPKPYLVERLLARGEYRRAARVALEVYHQRGEAALAQAKTGDIDGLIETLGTRKAAFHNFRAAEALALREENYDVANDPSLLFVWKLVADVDGELERVLTATRQRMSQDLGAAAEVRRTLSRYRSGRRDPVRLEKMA